MYLQTLHVYAHIVSVHTCTVTLEINLMCTLYLSWHVDIRIWSDTAGDNRLLRRRCYTHFSRVWIHQPVASKGIALWWLSSASACTSDSTRRRWRCDFRSQGCYSDLRRIVAAHPWVSRIIPTCAVYVCKHVAECSTVSNTQIKKQNPLVCAVCVHGFYVCTDSCSNPISQPFPADSVFTTRLDSILGIGFQSFQIIMDRTIVHSYLKTPEAIQTALW